MSNPAHPLAQTLDAAAGPAVQELPDPAVLSVSELNRRVARLLERQVPLLWVGGEVSNLTRASSGHWYFSLKDAQAQVRCVMFRQANRGVTWSLRNGDQIEARALAGLYAPRGDFQLTVEAMRQAGAGALYEAFLKTKAKLEAEGLFDASQKQVVPAFPRSIGVVTSLQAAALRDVLITLARRAPHVRVVVYPTPVQGRDAPERLVAAIDQASARASQLGEIDVLLLVRGGGSIEDLWAFNDEQVARAVARAQVPVVSGIGHETDVTVVDFVADVRAATPTAAAELASPDAPRLLARLADQSVRMRRALARRLETAEQRLDEAQRRLKSPRQRLTLRQQQVAALHLRLRQAMAQAQAQRAQRVVLWAIRLRQARADPARLMTLLGHLKDRLRRAATHRLDARQAALSMLLARLDLLDPHAALKRGYALVLDSSGQVVRDAARLAARDRIEVRLARGELSAEVLAARPGPDHAA